MRKTLIAIAIGASALLAACGGGSSSPAVEGASQAPLESAPVVSPMASPSEMVSPSGSPASS
jgi:hypothetical protein